MNTIQLTDRSLQTLLHTAINSATRDLKDGFCHSARLDLQCARQLIDQASEPLGDVVETFETLVLQVEANVAKLDPVDGSEA